MELDYDVRSEAYKEAVRLCSINDLDGGGRNWILSQLVYAFLQQSRPVLLAELPNVIRRSFWVPGVVQRLKAEGLVVQRPRVVEVGTDFVEVLGWVPTPVAIGLLVSGVI